MTCQNVDVANAKRSLPAIHCRPSVTKYNPDKDAYPRLLTVCVLGVGGTSTGGGVHPGGGISGGAF